MQRPQIVILEPDGWLAKQLRELAGENRWLIKAARSADSALALAGRHPSVLLVQFDPGEDRPETSLLIADAHRAAPDTPVVAVADVKLSDAERAAWTAALFDLGTRFVLVPPLTKSIVEDVVSGLMSATIRRTIGEAPAPAPERPEKPVLDLADERTEA